MVGGADIDAEVQIRRGDGDLRGMGRTVATSQLGEITLSGPAGDSLLIAMPECFALVSLQRGASASTVTSSLRAIARKSGGFGNRMGDIVLPEGRTVEHLAEEALTKAFRAGGYRVVPRGMIGRGLVRAHS